MSDCASSGETEMPIRNRLSRNLSPLEEDMTTKDVSHRAAGSSAPRLADQDTTALVSELGSLILSARCGEEAQPQTLAGADKLRARARNGCQSRPSWEDKPIAVNGETLPQLMDHILELWAQRLPFCIEVRGHAVGACPEDKDSSLLLEQWSVQALSKRPPSSGPPSSPHLLLQAVRSYLHFSQVRSWQQVGGEGHTPFPFRLLYRVCAPCDSGSDSTPCPTHHHAFPPVSLTPHSSLVVTVATLPRLPQVPKQLRPPSSVTSAHTSSSTAGNASVSSMGQSSDSSRGQSSSERVKCLTSAPWPLSIERLAKESPKEGFPFSPPLPSPLSPKLLMGLADRLTSDPSDPGNKGVSSLERMLRTVDLKSDPLPPPEVKSSSNGAARSRPTPTPTQDRSTSNGGGGAVPPAACSPAPFSRMHGNRERDGVKRRSCAISCKRPLTRAPPQRCNSAPVFVPSLCLLGTFEESVLNGRLEPCGYVEGFSVEVGASGSFCPPHVVLPVNAAFYSLHDNHGGTSPYLGQVDLSGVGKRGYQVPRKGTVQVTLFNPNHTVVKMFIVTYNFSDMPALTQTFLRQKTLSHPTSQGATPTSYLPSLHYLIHLRFLCSKSSRIYLHRDIRLIFARRAPDTDPDSSKVTLSTITEGPVEPKYSPSSSMKQDRTG